MYRLRVAYALHHGNEAHRPTRTPGLLSAVKYWTPGSRSNEQGRREIEL